MIVSPYGPIPASFYFRLLSKQNFVKWENQPQEQKIESRKDEPPLSTQVFESLKESIFWAQLKEKNSISANSIISL